eukprot:452889-Rhodomonas_salina.1
MHTRDGAEFGSEDLDMLCQSSTWRIGGVGKYLINFSSLTFRSHCPPSAFNFPQHSPDVSIPSPYENTSVLRNQTKKLHASDTTCSDAICMFVLDVKCAVDAVPVAEPPSLAFPLADASPALEARRPWPKLTKIRTFFHMCRQRHGQWQHACHASQIWWQVVTHIPLSLYIDTD